MENKMNFEKIEKLVSDYLSESLSEEGRRQLEDFLQTPTGDFTNLEMTQYHALVSGIYYSAEPVKPATDLKKRIFEQIIDEQSDVDLEMPLKEAAFVSVRAYEGQWVSMGEGLTAKFLNEDKEHNRTTMLVKMEAGSSYPAHSHSGVEELFVLEGDCLIGSELLRSGDYHRAHGGSEHSSASTENGCMMLIISPDIHSH